MKTKQKRKITTKTVYQIHELCEEKLMGSNFSDDGLIYCNYDKKHQTHLHIILFCIFMAIAKESILINPNDFFNLDFD